MKKILVFSFFILFVMSSCRDIINPVDPESDLFSGISEDLDGDGIGQYEDVDDIVPVSPADGDFVSEFPITLSTNPVNPAKITKFWVQVATSNNFSEINIIYENTEFTSNKCTISAGSFLDGTQYYWRTKSFDGSKWSDNWSEIWSFTVSLSISDINVKQGITNIPSSSGIYDFGSITEGSSSLPVNFTIENTGNIDLILTDSPNVSITGTDASMFSIGTQPSSPVSAGSNATFTITFSPTNSGNKSASVTIPNNDSDENPYTFTISGICTSVPEPEINIKQGVTTIPSTSGNYDFGSVSVGSSSPDVTFSIENIGSANLVLTGSPMVTIAGTDASMFSIGTQPSSPVGSSSNTAFTITFSPTSTGNKSATATIPNTDSDEDPYVISITGNGVGFPIGEWDSTNWDECLWAN